MSEDRDKHPPLTVKCPGCRNSIEWTEAFPHRPFCSSRCKDRDFIDWAEEKNRIGGSPDYDDILSDAFDG